MAKAVFNIRDNILKDIEKIIDLKQKQKILVVGQVQSGKTNFIMQLCECLLEKDFDAIVILGGTTNNLLDQTRDRFYKHKLSEKYQIIDIENTSYTKIPDNKIIISSLKAKESITKVNEMIYNSLPKKVAIFDDESDYAGQNIQKYGEGSMLYKLLKQMYERLYKGVYIGVTATPFADLLSNDSSDIDYVHLLRHNANYTGSHFFILNNLYEVVEITREQRRLEKSSKIWMEILKSHVERIYDSKLTKSQLLINNDLITDYHSKARDNINQILDVFLNFDLESIFSKKYEYDKVRKIILELKDNNYVLNGSESVWKNETHSIISGGYLVSRGYTFDNLLTCVMLNEPIEKNAADTLLQRARWFGYRNNIAKFMKIYVSQKVYDSYLECDDLIEKMELLIDKNCDNVQKIRHEIKKIKYENIIFTYKDKSRGKNE
ncbi:Z1 domain-containing protein [Mesoplasma seiffertii]|uniref:Z1 domain-containing protein n=1 Tax=Mesoplasma seiffertii TaxID=28224 RepID=UPI00047C6084|nr:Z1 domain-containing protein [Mesoplasma seiffertii]